MSDAEVLGAMERLEKKARRIDRNETIAAHSQALGEALPGTTKGCRDGIEMGVSLMVPPAVGGDPVKAALVGFALGVKLGQELP